MDLDKLIAPLKALWSIKQWGDKNANPVYGTKVKINLPNAFCSLVHLRSFQGAQG